MFIRYKYVEKGIFFRILKNQDLGKSRQVPPYKPKAQQPKNDVP